VKQERRLPALLERVAVGQVCKAAPPEALWSKLKATF
jgi:hypothetical protein